MSFDWTRPQPNTQTKLWFSSCTEVEYYIFNNEINLSSQISTNVSLSHVRTMEHAKILAVATCVTVPQASMETTVKTVGSLKCLFRKMHILIRVFSRFCEACFRDLFWRRLRVNVYYVTGLNPLCFHTSAYFLKHCNFLLRYQRMSVVPTMPEQWNLHRSYQRLPLWLYRRLQRNQLYNQ